MRRLSCLLALAVLAWPSAAIGKQGAMLDPQLLALPSGHTTRVRLWVLPVYRDSRWGPREVVSAPAAGSVPALMLELLGSRRVLRFTGTPLDNRGRSLVWITLPASTAPQHWKVWVRAGGRRYPDVIDSSANDRSTTPVTPAPRPPPIRPLPPSRAHPAALPAWLYLLGGVALTLVACGRAVRVGWLGCLRSRTSRR